MTSAGRGSVGAARGIQDLDDACTGLTAAALPGPTITTTDPFSLDHPADLPPASHDAVRAVVDIQCLSVAPSARRRGELGRCQLAAGHESEHAVMLLRGPMRTVRTWRKNDPASERDQAVAQESLPWVRGKPQPMWIEDSPLWAE